MTRPHHGRTLRCSVEGSTPKGCGDGEWECELTGGSFVPLSYCFFLPLILPDPGGSPFTHPMGCACSPFAVEDQLHRSKNAAALRRRVEWTVEFEQRLAEIAGWSSQKRECLVRARQLHRSENEAAQGEGGRTVEGVVSLL